MRGRVDSRLVGLWKVGRVERLSELALCVFRLRPLHPADKGALFRLGLDYDATLTASVVKHLNEDTGLDFGGADVTRFGDIELLVFPALDDQERPLLDVSWNDASRAWIAQFNSMQVPHFSGF